MPLTPSSAPRPRRRSLLAGTLSALAVLGGGTAGCSADSADAASSGTGSRAERELRRTATRQSRALLGRYDATVAAHSRLAQRLRPLREATAQHVQAFDDADAAGRRRQDKGSQSSSDSGPGTGPDSSPGTGRGAEDRSEAEAPEGKPDAVPGSEKAALAALADAEQRTADARTEALTDASPALARLLASVAAAGAAHAYLLKGKDDAA